MDARFAFAAILCALGSLGASHRTTNFVVTASSKEFAAEVANTAEEMRADLAKKWLGKELPAWRQPCPIRVHDGPQLGAGGATSFMFERGRPFGWRMTIQGSKVRILDSVLPHEITHTIFATHFGRPLPRWADEGACTTVEHLSERKAQHRYLIRFLNEERGIPFNRMFRIREYPRDVMPLYSQGYSVVKYLIYQGGHRKFVKFLGDGMHTDDWDTAVERHYGYDDLSDLQVRWVEWVKSGSPTEFVARADVDKQPVATPIRLASSTTSTANDSTSGGTAPSSSRGSGTRSPLGRVAATQLAAATKDETPRQPAADKPSKGERATAGNYYIQQAARASGGVTTYRR